MKKFAFLFLLVLLFTFNNCADDEVDAKKSINGFWTVRSIESFYGEFTANGHNGLRIVKNEGSLGSFEFAENGRVKYKFLRNDTIYQDTTSWTLKLRSELTVGFRTTKYAVEVQPDYNFGVTFGDGSKNAKKDARELILEHFPSKPGYGVGIILMLTKQ